MGLLTAPLLLAGLAFAQEPPELLQLVRVHVNHEHVSEWRELTTKVSAAYEKADAGFRHVWRNRMNPYEFVITTPRENYASFDEPGALQRGMSDDERTKLVARRGALTESVEIRIARPIPEFAIPWEGEQPPNLVMTVTTLVKPDKVSEFVEVTSEYVEKMKEKGIKGYGGHRVLWGAPRTTVVTWSALDKMAELDDGNRVLQVWDDRTARSAYFERRFATYAQPNQSDIWVYEAALSYHPAE